MNSDMDYRADELDSNLETTAAPTCPSNFSFGPNADGDCKCNEGLVCYYQGEEGACPHKWSDTGSTWFLPTCVDCICQAPPTTAEPAPTTPETTPSPTPEP